MFARALDYVSFVGGALRWVVLRSSSDRVFGVCKTRSSTSNGLPGGEVIHDFVMCHISVVTKRDIATLVHTLHSTTAILPKRFRITECQGSSIKSIVSWIMLEFFNVLQVRLATLCAGVCYPGLCFLLIWSQFPSLFLYHVVPLQHCRLWIASRAVWL